MEEPIKQPLATSGHCLALLVGYCSLLLLLIISDSNIIRATAQQQDWLLAPTESCQQLKLVKRQEWGAKESLERLDSFGSSLTADGVYATRTPNRVFIHQAWDGRSCADIDSCSIRLQAIQAYHQNSKGWPDISYNFLIASDGTIYEGLGFTRVGFHTLDYNYNSLGVAFIGTFQDIHPTGEMERALQDLLQCAVDSNYLVGDYMLHGHRDARCTICPGDAAYARISQMANFRPGPLARYSCLSRQAAGIDSERQQSVYSSMMLMKNEQHQRQPQQVRPAGTQVLNINSNNHLVAAAAVASDGQRERPAVAPAIQEEETIVGVFRRKQTPQPRGARSDRSLLNRDDTREDDGDGIIKASLNKGSKDQVILLNIQPQPQQQQPQPTLYLLTTRTISKTSPILLISPTVSSPGSQSTASGGGDNAASGTSRPSNNNNNNGINSMGSTGQGGGSNAGGNSGQGGGNSNGDSNGAAQRPSQTSSGGDNSGGNGGATNSRNQSSDGNQSSGGGFESQFRVKVDTEPVSLLDKLFDFDIKTNTTNSKLSFF